MINFLNHLLQTICEEWGDFFLLWLNSFLKTRPLIEQLLLKTLKLQPLNVQVILTHLVVRLQTLVLALELFDHPL